MDISTILDVAIGLAFVYLLLSVLCSGLNELVAQSTGRRGRFLREGLLNLLSDRWFYLRLINHPLISAYRRDSAGKARNPSYLPSEAVAQALLDLLVQKAGMLENKASGNRKPVDFKQVRKAAEKCHAEGFVIAGAFLPLLDQANEDLGAASKAVAAWYDSSMERVSGWYKQSSRNSLFVIGAFLAVLLNVDSIEVTRSLMTSDSLREAVVKEAIATAATGKIGGVQIIKDGVAVPPSREDVETLVDAGEKLEIAGLPIGFSCLAPVFEAKDGEPAAIGELVDGCLNAVEGTSGTQRFFKIVGWLITALALTFGAPFWFDLLNKLVNLRGAGGKPPAVDQRSRAAQQAT